MVTLQGISGQSTKNHIFPSKCTTMSCRVGYFNRFEDCSFANLSMALIDDF